VIGIVYDAPDQESAIKKAIEELKVPADSTRSAGGSSWRSLSRRQWKLSGLNERYSRQRDGT
jgi:hypothetical protein